MKTIKEKIDWIVSQHRNTNHMYDEYLPYEFHLRMVVAVHDKFKHLVEPVSDTDVLIACWAHDMIEDTRVTYNDVKKVLGYESSELVYAVTNEKGKNRSERANDKYYKGIKDIKYATFVKLCDRIANVEYSKMSGSSMFDLYKKENKEFLNKLGVDRYNLCYPMAEYLNQIFSK